MARRVSLLALLHGVLAIQTGGGVPNGTNQGPLKDQSSQVGTPSTLQAGALAVSDESSDSTPGHRKSYYLFQLLPIHRLKGKPENAFDRKAADLLAMRTSSVFGAPDIIRPTVSKVASFQLPPARVIPRQSPSTPIPPLVWGSTALRGPVLTLSAQSKTMESSGATSVPGNLGTCCGMSARFSPVRRVLTTPGFPTRGPLQSTMFPTSPTTKEPRGDV